MTTAPMDAQAVASPNVLWTSLGRLARRWRLHRFFDGAVRFYVLLLVVAVLQVVLDGWIRMPREQRVVVTLLAAVVLAAGVGWWLLRPWLRALPAVWLAQLVDRAHPELHDLVATAVQFSQGKLGKPESNSPRLVAAVLEEARAEIRAVQFEHILPGGPARRRLVELATLVAVTLAVALPLGDVTAAWFQRNWLLQDVPWPQRTTIRPEHFDATGRRHLPVGDEVVVQALNEGVVPRAARIEWQTASGARGSEPMTRLGAVRWEARLGVLAEDVLFRIIGGDERSPEFRIVAVERPRIVRTRVTVTPPAYTRRPAETFEQRTTLELPAGAALAIEAELNKPIAAAAFVAADGTARAADLPAPTRVRLVWPDPQGGTYQFALRDEHGFENRRPARFALQIVADEPPEVRLRLPGVGGSITPGARLPLEVELQDEYGLMSAVRLIARNDDPAYEQTLTEVRPGQMRAVVVQEVVVADLGVAPGDRLRLQVSALDIAEPEANFAASAPARLRVVTARELRTELAARELELRREFERLLSAQRGLAAGLDQLLPELPEAGAPPPVLGQRLIGLARRQATHARACLQIAESYGQILSEMQINGIAREGDERRIGERIRAPLEQLGAQTLPDAAERLRALQGEIEPGAVAGAPNEQAAIIAAMRDVLASMLEWEGYREAIVLLEEIIAEQGALREETAAALEAELADILGLDDPPADDD